jgi:hypothetical protein
MRAEGLSCTKHKIICCTKCLYGNTGRHDSTDNRQELEVTDFMSKGINFRLREYYSDSMVIV